MTQEHKELLLLIDLCARLPYGVKVLGPWEKYGPCELSEINLKSSQQIRIFEDWFSVENCKPYLRPMSSMTEEEEEEYWTIRMPQYNDNGNIINTDAELFDWLNKKMFDYRGLIEKGLALEAPKGMYN